jgi:hypothetical protein
VSRDDIEEQAGYFIGILLAIAMAFGVIHGFERLLRPQLLVGIALVTLAAWLLNWWSINRIRKLDTSHGAFERFSKTKKGAAFYGVGALLFGVCIFGLGFL